MTYLLPILSILAALVLARCGLWLVRRYNRARSEYAEAANQFYEAADRLVDNPNTPANVLEFLELMNVSINYPYSAMLFVQRFQKGRSHGEARRKPSINLRTMPQDVVADFVIAFEAWTNAMAYRSVFWGPIFKAYLDTPSVEAEAKKVAAMSQKTIEAH